MTFTPLELLLGGAMLSLLTALAVRLITGGSFVTRDQCRLNHENECRTNADLNRKMDIQFRMLRAIVVYLPLSAAKKEEILNERGSAN